MLQDLFSKFIRQERRRYRGSSNIELFLYAKEDLESRMMNHRCYYFAVPDCIRFASVRRYAVETTMRLNVRVTGSNTRFF